MNCWYTSYCYIRYTYDRLTNKNASTVMRTLSQLTSQADLKQYIDIYMDAFDSIQKRAANYSHAYRQFVDSAFDIILRKTCRELIPELSYAAYVYMRQRGLIDLLEDLLEQRVDSVEKLGFALVVCRNVKFVNKLCLEIDVATRINQLVTPNTDYVFHMFCNSTLFERNAQLVNWLITHATTIMDPTSDLEAFFVYARQVFSACHGDSFLFYTCVRTINKVIMLPSVTSTVDTTTTPTKLVPFMTHLATIAGNQPVVFYLHFAPTCSKRRLVYALDFAASYIPEHVGATHKLVKRRCGIRNIFVPDANDFVIRTRTNTTNFAANEGCFDPPSVGTIRKDTIIEFSTSIKETAHVTWVFSNFRVENRAHFSLHGVRLYVLCRDRILEINLISGVIKCLYVLDLTCSFCQFFPENKIVVYDRTINKYMRRPVRDLTCQVQHVKQNMFYPKEFFPYMREFLGSCADFFELRSRALFYLNKARFFGHLNGKRYFLNDEFVVFLV